jgi:NTP pyrophosphatase (non-canonical NTP hydrolase)
MEITEAQKLMRRIYFQRDSTRGVDRTIIRAFEELGELSDAVLKKKNHATVADEMADVLAWICSLANLLDVDLSSALIRKYNGVCSRCKRAPCECTDAP